MAISILILFILYLFVDYRMVYNSTMNGFLIPPPATRKFPWTCPYCNRPTTVTHEDRTTGEVFLDIENSDGERCLNWAFVVCPNPDCRRFTLTIRLSKVERYSGSRPHSGEELHTWQLVPPSGAKIFPDYIPTPILADYREACLIKELSPKSSATLARRCLQGMIRDYWGLERPSLKKEIEAIQDKVDPLTWDAIDAVRKVGNIGAHMAKKVDIIIDIEPNEAELLIGLIERLFEDWYIAREKRQNHLKSVVNLGQTKDKLAKAANQIENI